jgi:hypothetical protein
VDSGVRAFKDTAGRTWVVSVTVADLKRIRQLTGIELGKLPVGKLVETLSDPETFVDVLFVLVKDQADRAGISDEQFGRSLGGDTLENASQVFWRAWADFCPSQTRRLLLGLAETAEERTRELVDKALEELRTPTTSGTPSPSPAPPGSNPTGGPSAS